MIEVVPFEEDHIPYKIKWINNPEINKFLHYDLPLTIEGTYRWYVNKSSNRKDYTILYNEKPIGIIGILDICNFEGEFYITIGELQHQGKGIAFEASKIFLNNIFKQTNLEKVYLTTEPKNKKAHKLFEKIGFQYKGYRKNQFYYELDRIHFYSSKTIKGELLYETPIIGPYIYKGNTIYIKRDDLYPYSIGGNKAKKISIIEQNYDFNEYDAIITYGSKKSNHVRATLQLALKYELEMHVVTTDSKNTFSSNSYVNSMFGAIYYTTSVDKVSFKIENLKKSLKGAGKRFIFIPGGGHLPEGTHAYTLTMKEIHQFEKDRGLNFDFIFHSSGTGGTQAGLIAGEMIANGNPRRIVGISVGRDCVRGKKHIKNALEEYLDCSVGHDDINFRDDLVPYKYSDNVYGYSKICKLGIEKFDLELDPTYTSKSFAGMLEYIKEYKVMNKSILYIHTGGRPIFYDRLQKNIRES